MTLFVDTSALLAFLDADQPRHSDAVDAWRKAMNDRDTLVTSNYVLVETFALVQRRLGLDALRDLASDFLPLMQPLWVDEALHAAATAALFTAGRRKLSLVDCTSFEIMRRHGITHATTTWTRPPGCAVSSTRASTFSCRVPGASGRACWWTR